MNKKLKDLEIFSEAARSTLELADKHKRVYQFKRGHLIYYENTPSSGLFCVVEGLAKQCKSSEDGKQYITRLARAGESLGLETIFQEVFFDTSAEMISPGEVWFFPKSILRQCLQTDQQLCMTMLKLLADQVVQGNEERLELAHGCIRERMATLLDSLAKRHGVYVNGHSTIDLNLTREEIAEMTGTVTETAVRLLSDFKEEKIVATEGRKIIILDPQKLSAMTFDRVAAC